ncbi:hypothetical protein WDW37_21605 [Bdellovibrionota bacterium FG-1]
MKSVFLSLLLVLSASNTYAADIQGFGVIREFGGNDNAAMFGLLSQNGTLQITDVSGPAFLGGYRVGELDQVAIDHLFLKSSKPMDQKEKLDLISKYNGAQVIYFEGYTGNLCRSNEIEYDISASGNVNGAPFTATIQFIALPNSSGDCGYHKFITVTQS